ncbi:MAG TPA: T9SS type A sorting domain-containing protein, partial [Chitinophagaceae bacterium]|nr:T9SS type A sorting domain-containing protein [Chitinophagaceae bacterium]
GGGGGIIYTNGTLGSGNVGGGSNGVTRTGSAGGTLNNSFGATSGTAGQVVSFPNSVPTLVNATNPASPCGVLPVKLSSFRGLIQPGGVTLMWDIENAVDLHHFNIEYSTDGRTFQQTGTRDYVAGKTAYDFLHALNLPQVLYYRLKMVDADGVFTYSKIITLRTNRSGGSLLLYPNPAKEAVTLQVKASASDDATISVIDAAGRRVMQKNTVVQKGDNVIGLEVQSLQSGLYTVEISLKNGNTFRERLRVIKN